jgi:hypothetical protein
VLSGAARPADIDAGLDTDPESVDVAGVSFDEPQPAQASMISIVLIHALGNDLRTCEILDDLEELGTDSPPVRVPTGLVARTPWQYKVLMMPLSLLRDA